MYFLKHNLWNECQKILILPEWPQVLIQNCVCKLGCRKTRLRQYFELVWGSQLKWPPNEGNNGMKNQFLSESDHSYFTKWSVLAQGWSKVNTDCLEVRCQVFRPPKECILCFEKPFTSLRSRETVEFGFGHQKSMLVQSGKLSLHNEQNIHAAQP